jgi:hypothetical protein
VSAPIGRNIGCWMGTSRCWSSAVSPRRSTLTTRLVSWASASPCGAQLEAVHLVESVIVLFDRGRVLKAIEPEEARAILAMYAKMADFVDSTG